MCIDTFKNECLVWTSVIEIFGEHGKMCGVRGYSFSKFSNNWKVNMGKIWIYLKKWSRSV